MFLCGEGFAEQAVCEFSFTDSTLGLHIALDAKTNKNILFIRLYKLKLQYWIVRCKFNLLLMEKNHYRSEGARSLKYWAQPSSVTIGRSSSTSDTLCQSLSRLLQTTHTNFDNDIRKKKFNLRIIKNKLITQGRNLRDVYMRQLHFASGWHFVQWHPDHQLQISINTSKLKNMNANSISKWFS